MTKSITAQRTGEPDFGDQVDVMARIRELKRLADRDDKGGVYEMRWAFLACALRDEGLVDQALQVGA